MKFLIAGLGSIGQRHYKNLQTLGFPDLIVYRTGKGSQNFVSEFEKEHSPKIFLDLTSAFNEKPDAILIANPTVFHADFIREGLEHGVKGIFVEKPISHTAESLRALVETARKNNVVGYTGYNFRFHPLLQRMKELVDQGVIGKVISASVDMGEYLPDWHPWEDYRTTYPAKKELGGGVVLTQSHDIDYLYWFFGMPKKIAAFGGTQTGLEVDVEDSVKSIFEYEDGKTVSLHMDFYQRPPRRIFEIMGRDGTLRWDYYAKTLTLTPHKKEIPPTITGDPERFDRNSMFLAELAHFVDCVEGKARPEVSFEDGFNVLKICEAMLSSIAHNAIVHLSV
ncbi:MAG: Gfo/Idh/MocA family oxidoreductase [Candidatus Spechtbacteria bacterium]|nr:Gfo/Idh/MocA family oxidoreductase [Candidatus Spechtbacteria bacterium]